MEPAVHLPSRPIQSDPTASPEQVTYNQSEGRGGRGFRGGRGGRGGAERGRGGVGGGVGEYDRELGGGQGEGGFFKESHCEDPWAELMAERVKRRQAQGKTS